MRRVLIAAATVGAFAVSIYVVTGGGLLAQSDFLADGGITGPTHVATCPVRLDPDCVDAGVQAGLNVHTYERLRFPVYAVTTADGGLDVTLPPMAQGRVRACVEVVDWSDCTMVPAGAAPAVAAKWGNPLPFSIAGVVRKCVRPNFGQGLNCLRKLSDGGSFSFGDRNVYQRTEAVDPAQCESVECTIYFGDDPERDL